jgi:glycerol kinase
VTELVLGLDQGTSSTRCVALDRDLREHGRAQVPVACSFPRPGWVEQDPEALLASALEAIAGAAPAAGLPLGIANQTETFIVWERGSGRAIHPAIVWQDRRTEDACAALRTAGHEPLIRRRTGLELDATFPATKLAWVLDHVDGARAAAQAGELAYGDVACWLTYKLTGEHVTDAGNAGRTLLCPLGGTDWDDELLDLFEIPRVLLPPIVASDALAAPSARAAPGTPRPAAPSARAAPGTPRPVAPSAHDIPRVVGSAAPTPRIVAALGDQQASLFGLRCWTPGAAKVTLGTGAFLLVQAGSAPPTPPEGVLASCAWRRGETTSYALEGFVPTAGAAVDWFTRLGALPPARELDALVRTAADDDLVCVPTLQGTGVPTWNPMATGALFGLRLSHTRADLARAVVDGILHQVVDGLEAMTVDVLKVDGGLSRSDWVVQRLADLSGVRVERTSRPDSTALGAAMLAGLAAGLWEAPEAIPEIPVDLVAQPALSAAERSLRRGRWASACELSDQWPQ